MAEPATRRPFQQRFLDGFERSQLRQEVQKIKPRLSKFHKKYVTWALGASLAVGGIGAPLKIVHDAQNKIEQPGGQPSAQEQTPESLQGDLASAENIARQVAGGAADVAQGVQQGVQQAVQQAAQVPVEAVTAAPQVIAQVPQQIAQTAEQAKAHFFAKEVPFGSIIYREAKKNDLRPELVAAVIQQESKFHPTARSHMGAQGLMQLVPRTGRWMGARNLMNPVENIAAGTKYLKYLHERFNGNETKVIAAYNAGEGNVRRFGGVPPFRETRKYVSNVRNYQRDFVDRVDSHVAELGAPAFAPEAR